MVKKVVIFSVLLLLIAMIVIKVARIDKDEKFLNFFARYYFDEQYYITNYPDILEQDIDPFEHYVNFGWK